MNGIIKVKIWSAVMVIFSLIGSFESQAATPDSMVYSFYFRQGDDLLLRDYRTNKQNIATMKQWMTAENIARVTSIKIIGATSPEGVFESNNRLTHKRVYSVRSYITWRWGLNDQSNLYLYSYADPLSGWIRAVENDMSVPRRDKVLEILNSDTLVQTKWANIKLLAGGASQYMRQQIFPSLYNVVVCVIFFNEAKIASSAASSDTSALSGADTPLHEAKTVDKALVGTIPNQVSDAEVLRPSDKVDQNGEASLLGSNMASTTASNEAEIASSEISNDVSTQSGVDKTALEESTIDPVVSVAVTSEVVGVLGTAQSSDNVIGSYGQTVAGDTNIVLPEIEQMNKPLFALKTNLLFDAATILNLEVEIPIREKFSIAVEGMFPWWLWEGKQNCIQVMSANIEGRFWFGDRNNKPLMSGWYAGVYAGGGYYDLEWNRKGYQGEFFIAAGISGGFAHTINKKGTLRMEYGVGVGYMSTDYRSYEAKFSNLANEWHLYRQETGRFSWFGPTRAKVSLVWLLDTDLFRKKGARK